MSSLISTTIAEHSIINNNNNNTSNKNNNTTTSSSRPKCPTHNTICRKVQVDHGNKAGQIFVCCKDPNCNYKYWIDPQSSTSSSSSPPDNIDTNINNNNTNNISNDKINDDHSKNSNINISPITPQAPQYPQPPQLLINPPLLQKDKEQPSTSSIDDELSSPIPPPITEYGSNYRRKKNIETDPQTTTNINSNNNSIDNNRENLMSSTNNKIDKVLKTDINNNSIIKDKTTLNNNISNNFSFFKQDQSEESSIVYSNKSKHLKKASKSKDVVEDNSSSGTNNKFTTKLDFSKFLDDDFGEDGNDDDDDFLLKSKDCNNISTTTTTTSTTTATATAIKDSNFKNGDIKNKNNKNNFEIDDIFNTSAADGLFDEIIEDLSDTEDENTINMSFDENKNKKKSDSSPTSSPISSPKISINLKGNGTTTPSKSEPMQTTSRFSLDSDDDDDIFGLEKDKKINLLNQTKQQLPPISPVKKIVNNNNSNVYKTSTTTTTTTTPNTKITTPTKKKPIDPYQCIPIDDDDDVMDLTTTSSKFTITPIKPQSPHKTRLPFDQKSIDQKKTNKNGKSNNDNEDGGNSKFKPKRTNNREVIIDFQVIETKTVGTTYPVPDIPDTAVICKLFRETNGVFNVEDGTWSFTFNDYDKLCEKFIKLKSTGQPLKIMIKLVPKEVFQYLDDPWYIKYGKQFTKSKITNPAPWSSAVHSPHKGLLGSQPEGSKFDCTRIPATLLSSLLKFQMKGLTFGVQQKGKCLIADEMGLGKTIQALAIASYFESEWPLLIICPSSLRLNWSREIEKWFPKYTGNISVIMNGDGRADASVNIVSYDLMNRILEKELLPRQFKAIICDESHYLKNLSAQRTKNLLRLIQGAKIRVLLTGTPALSRPIELYPQLVALECPIYKDQLEFAKRYCNAYKGRYGWDFLGNSHLQELHVLLRGVMIRRLKQQVLEDLPPKHRIKVVVDVPISLQTKVYDMFSRTKSKIRSATSNGGEGSEREQMMQLYVETGRAKLKASQEYILNLMNDKKKFLIFAHHSEVLDGLEQTIISARANYIRIDGSTPASVRQANVNRFQNNPNCTVALLSITAAGTGLTLTASSLVVFVELYWTPGVLRQAEDRVHRIGQKSDVNIHYLIGKNTLDDRIWPIICNKLEVLGETLDGQEEILHTKHVDLRGTLGIKPINQYFKKIGGDEELEDELVFSIVGDDDEIISNFSKNNNENDEEDEENEDDSNSKGKKRKSTNNQTSANKNSNNVGGRIRNPNLPDNYYQLQKEEKERQQKQEQLQVQLQKQRKQQQKQYEIQQESQKELNGFKQPLISSFFATNNYISPANKNNIYNNNFSKLTTTSSTNRNNNTSTNNIKNNGKYNNNNGDDDDHEDYVDLIFDDIEDSQEDQNKSDGLAFTRKKTKIF
eukprot:gene6804-8443_t